MANPFADIDTSPPKEGGRQPVLELTVRPSGAERPNPFADIDTSAPPSPMMGLAKAAGTGVVKGVTGLLGLPDMAKRGMAAASDFFVSPEAAKQNQAMREQLRSGYELPSAGQIDEKVQSVTGPYYKPQTTPEKYAETIGSFLPGAVMGPGNMAANALKYGIIPGAASEAAGQATEGTALEPYARIAGGIAGIAVPAIAKRAITPLPASQASQEAASVLKNEGVEVTAGQKTGSNFAKWMESTSKDLPGGAGGVLERQKEQFTAAALKRAGETASRATPDVIEGAFARIGQTFDDVASRNALRIDRGTIGELQNVWKDYSSVTNQTARAPIVENTIRDMLDYFKTGKPLPGEMYLNWRSQLDKQARSLRFQDPQLSSAMGDMVQTLDKTMERSMRAAGNTADMAALKQARREYKNLLVIEKAATGAGADAASGLISPSQLRNATVQQNRRAYAKGQGDMAGLARAGETILKDLPNSGTAARLAAQNVLGAGGGALGFQAGGDVLSSLAGAAGGYASAALGARALMSKPVQAYLGNQVLSGPVRGQNIYSVLSNSAPQVEKLASQREKPRQKSGGNSRSTNAKN